MHDTQGDAGTAGDEMEPPAAPAGPTLLTRAQIFAARDITTEVVEVPAWGGAVMVRTMTGHERDRLEESMIVEKHGERSASVTDFRAKVCAMTIVDAEGTRLFSEADIKELSKKSAGALARVAEVATRLAGMSKADVTAIEADLKNGPGAASS